MQRSSALVTLACVAALSSVSPRPARACSALPALALEAVAHADVRGPIVFITRCSASSADACAMLASLRIQRNGDRTAVPGSIQLKPLPGDTDQLVIFTPTSALDATSTYSVLLGELATPLTSFSFLAPAAPAPLDRASATLTTRVEDLGPSYSCDFDRVPSGECNPKSGLGWSERGLVHSVLRVRAGGSDGWLLREYDGPPRAEASVGGHWLTTVETDIDLSAGAESCVSIDAWNVVTDVRATRSLCMSGPVLSAKERDVLFSTPNLGECNAVPKHSENYKEATELLAVWCRDRRQHCAGRGNGPLGCAPLDPRCDQLVTSPVGGATGPAAADGGSRSANPRADAGVPADPATAQLDDDNEGGGCSVGNEPAQAGQFGPLALLLLARNRRRRSRRVR